MSFDEKISALAEKIPSLINHLETEEATKNALIMPFIAALGYDVFNPKEVVPEFVADHGTKKGEKVDYAIIQENEVIILIECKQAKYNLCDANMSQLFRYFTVTKSRIAILTNGINYLFFSDLEAPNKMDSRPFLELDMLNLRKNLLAEVKKLGKEKFDLDRMLRQ
ncbi:type I restriction endonuclease [Desulfobacula sp.]|uniref:type I restriction endonuclease n=1 Tax=Desulfobacula sp. TaxID=2593537 RepID=UPI002603C2E0|nr:type I restriction endonuclease [Desulfobacula sp.]